MGTELKGFFSRRKNALALSLSCFFLAQGAWATHGEVPRDIPIYDKAPSGPLSFLFGSDPEKSTGKQISKENQSILEKGTQRLAQRLATLSLCTYSQGHQGHTSSTLEWYVATALSTWNDELLAKYPPSTELSFDRKLFEKSFKEEVSRRLNNGKVPQNFENQSGYFSEILKVFTENVFDNPRQIGRNSTQSLSVFSQSGRKVFTSDMKNLHNDSKQLGAACGDVKKGSSFWGKYSFLDIPRTATQPHSLKKKENIVQRIIPGKEVSNTTENLIDIAYAETFKYRNSSRSVVGSKDDSDSLGRCAMYVAISLQKQGCTPEFRAPDAKAFNIGQSLRSYGFKNLLDSNGNPPRGVDNIYDFPPGTVLVYSGGTAGHVEIRSRRGVISDYYSPNARTGSSGAFSGRGRRLIGAYVKPSCGAGEFI